MPLTKSNTNLYYQDTTFTYGTTPTVITIPMVTDVDEDYKADPKYASGDNAPGPRVKVNTNEMRTITLHSSALSVLKSIPRGVEGTLVTKRPDSKNGVQVGGGGVLITMSNCSIHENKTSGKYNDYAQGQVTFSAIWTQDAENNWVDPVAVTDL